MNLTSIVEMDTVEGKRGGKVLLTMLFRNSKLMLAFLLNDKTSNSVLKVFNWLESILGNDLFEKTFPVILTDNGSEFLSFGVGLLVLFLGYLTLLGKSILRADK